MNTYNVTFVMDDMILTTNVLINRTEDPLDDDIIDLANSKLVDSYGIEPLMIRHNDITVELVSV